MADSRMIAQNTEFLSVKLGGQEYAVDIRSIREIRGWIASTHLPFAPDYVKGMINLRGSVLVVVDLARRLGFAQTEPGSASVVVVVESAGRSMGLLVDEVCDIINVTDDMRQSTPETGSGVPKLYVDGVVMMEDRIISILSVAAVVPDEKIQQMAETIAA